MRFLKINSLQKKTRSKTCSKTTAKLAQLELLHLAQIELLQLAQIKSLDWVLEIFASALYCRVVLAL